MGEKNPPRSCQSGHITTAAVLKRRGGGGERGWGEKRGPIRKWLEGAKKKWHCLPVGGWIEGVEEEEEGGLLSEPPVDRHVPLP